MNVYESGLPGELFIVMSKEGSTLSGLLDGGAVVASLLLQHGGGLATLVSKWASTSFEPAGRTDHPCIQNASSILDYIARWLAQKFLTLEEMTQVGLKTSCHECGKAGQCDLRYWANHRVV